LIEVRRIKSVIEYDGSNYSGFQFQLNGLSVQEVLEKGLAGTLGHKTRVMAASRTDGGVHARGQVIAFDTTSNIPAARIPQVTNNHLPPDIRMLTSEDADPGFNPRYGARSKEYHYLMYRKLEGSAFHQRYAWVYNLPLDTEVMREALAKAKGQQDFSSFCASGSQVRSHVRTITRAELFEEEPWLRLEVEGDGFLYHMIRILMGTLVEVGRGFWGPDDMERILLGRDRRKAGPTAPASGLNLIKVVY
jgi:tRNA pseudouridine38-40 synthase